MKRLLSFIVVLISAGSSACSAPEPARDHAVSDEDIAEVGEPVTCNPGLARYPVKGPHNGGYDANALSYTCPPHPGGSPDNSDYIAGSHYGNDLFGAKGTPIVAPVSGVIVKAGWDTTGGNRVTVQDGCGWHYYHAHLDSIAVSVGQQVNAGDVIGTLGNSGSAQGTSPHLHFSIYPESYNSGIDPFPYLQAVDGTSCPAQCKPHCEGSVIVGSDCGKGDCAFYGATCVDDQKGVRCASVFCPALGQKKVCVDDALIGDCSDGAISVGDCSAYGAGCVDDVEGARCVVVFCLDHPAKAHDVCLPNGQLGHCTNVGGLSVEDCPAAKPCTQTASGAQCGKPAQASGGSGGAPSGGDAPSGGNSSGGATSAGGTGGWAGSMDSFPSGRAIADPADSDPVQGGCACTLRPRESGSMPAAAALFLALCFGLRRRRGVGPARLAFGRRCARMRPKEGTHERPR